MAGVVPATVGNGAVAYSRAAAADVHHPEPEQGVLAGRPRGEPLVGAAPIGVAAPEDVDPPRPPVDPHLGHVPPVVLAGGDAADRRVGLLLLAGGEGQQDAADAHRAVGVEEGQAVAHPQPAGGEGGRLLADDVPVEQVVGRLVRLGQAVGEHRQIEPGRGLEQLGHHVQDYHGWLPRTNAGSVSLVSAKGSFRGLRPSPQEVIHGRFRHPADRGPPPGRAALQQFDETGDGGGGADRSAWS